MCVTETPTTLTLTSMNLQLFQESPYTSTTTGKVSPVIRDYIWFQTDGKTSRATKCAQLRASEKFIDSILDAKSFLQKCVLIKGVFYSD